MKAIIAIMAFALVAFALTAVQPAHAEDCNTVCAAKPAGPMRNACIKNCAKQAKSEPAPAKVEETKPRWYKLMEEKAKEKVEEMVDRAKEVALNHAEAEAKSMLESLAPFIAIGLSLAIIALAAMSFRLKKRIDKNFETLKQCDAQRPKFGNVKNIINRSIELVGLKNRLDKAKENPDIHTLPEEISQIRANLEAIQAKKNEFSAKMKTLSESPAGADPDEFAFDAAKSGNKKAIALIEAHKACLAEIEALRVKLENADKREEQVADEMSTKRNEVDRIRQEVSYLTQMIKEKEAEIAAITAVPPIPLR